jgi:glycosyltransferase involved in cell wall biosynthesis
MAKICLVTHFFPPHIGGIEKVADEQCRRLVKLGYQVSVLTSKTSKQSEPRAEGIKVFSYSILNLAERVGVPYPVLSFKAYKNFVEAIKKCDIVHAHGHAYMSSYIACKVAQKYKKPFILTQHNTFIDYQSWLNIVEHVNDWTVGRVVLKGSDRVITVSSKTMEYVLKLGADMSKTSVMHNGVDTTFFHPMNRKENRGKLGLPKNKTLILTIRRLVYKNGLDTFIESASLLTRDYPYLLFIVIGKGPNRTLIEKRVRELGIGDNVRLAGFVPEKLLPLYYNAADYFVIPSSSGEGLPLVLLEAMACGLPVIATTVGGTPEIIKDMKNGVLVPPRKPKALAETISKFLLNKELGLAIGEEARKTVEDRFTWEENVRQLRDVYDEFL